MGGLTTRLATAFDSLTSLVRGLGTSADPRTTITPNVNFVPPATLEAWYTSWLGGKVVDLPADAMTRAWRRFEGQDVDPKIIEQLEKAEKRLKIKKKVNQVIKWSRLYGGGALILIVDGHGELHQPLDRTKIKKGQLKQLVPIESSALLAARGVYLQEITNPIFGLPEFYRISRGNVDVARDIHHTRIIRFNGYDLPWNLFVAHNFWGQSVLERCVEAIKDAIGTNQNVAALIFRAAAETMKIDGLAQMLSDQAAENTLIKRLALMNQMKSNVNMSVIDKEEEIVTNQVGNFSGLDQIMERMMVLVSAASDIPVTRLVGTSAKGLNSTGEGDEKQWMEAVSSLQEDKLREPLEELDEVFVRSELGGIPEDLTFRFNELFVRPESEKADTNLKQAQADILYIQNEVLSPEVVAKDLKEKGTYQNLTDEDIEAMEGPGFDEFSEEDEISITGTEDPDETEADPEP